MNLMPFLPSFSLLILLISLVKSEIAYRETDFYTRFSYHSFMVIHSLAKEIDDKNQKERTYHELAFIAFNYYMQVTRKMIQPNLSFDKTIRHFYAEVHNKTPELFLDPLLWAGKDSTPIFELPNSHSIDKFENYWPEVVNYIKFLESKEDYYFADFED